MIIDQIIDEIEAQRLIEGLIPSSGRIEEIAAMMLRGGATAVETARTVTDLNDRLVKKILGIAEAHLGTPPEGYCWIAFGSEGRKEQIIKTDQDNALVYAAPQPGSSERKATAYFSEFSRLVEDSLVRCGFPPCPAKYMASNPKWCQSLGTWKRYFGRRIFSPTLKDVVNSLIFFDLRPLYGDFSLSDSLEESLMTILDGQMVFLGYMAKIIVRTQPPRDFAGPFVVERSGDQRTEIDLKGRLLLPIVDIVRLFSLEKGIRETSTAGRIDSLRKRDRIIGKNAEGLRNAFEYAMSLRVRHQFEKRQAGSPPDDNVSADHFDAGDRRSLKEVFRLLAKLQDVVRERYSPLIG
jgi:CBS domain-containing protein